MKREITARILEIDAKIASLRDNLQQQNADAISIQSEIKALEDSRSAVLDEIEQSLKSRLGL